MNTSYLEMVATSCKGWTSGILSNLCPNICLVPHYARKGPIDPKLWAVTQICIPLLVIGSLLSYVEMVATSCKGWISWYLCYFIKPVSEYLSGPSLYVEWTNWSKILASCSDMYTSPGNRWLRNASHTLLQGLDFWYLSNICLVPHYV